MSQSKNSVEILNEEALARSSKINSLTARSKKQLFQVSIFSLFFQSKTISVIFIFFLNRPVITSSLDSQANGVNCISGSQQNLAPVLAATAAAAAAATGAFDYSAYYNQPWMLNSGINQQQSLLTNQMSNQQMTNSNLMANHQMTNQISNQQMANQMINQQIPNLNIPPTLPGTILPSLQTVTDQSLANSVYDPANMVTNMNMGAAGMLPVSTANPSFMGSAAAALRNMSAAAIYQQNTGIDYSATPDYSNQANLTSTYQTGGLANDGGVPGQQQQQQQQQQQNPSGSNFDGQYPVYDGTSNPTNNNPYQPPS